MSHPPWWDEARRLRTKEKWTCQQIGDHFGVTRAAVSSALVIMGLKGKHSAKTRPKVERVKVRCTGCRKLCRRRPKTLPRVQPFFCTPRCRHEHSTVERRCATCNKVKRVYPRGSRRKEHYRVFCDMDCRREFFWSGPEFTPERLAREMEAEGITQTGLGRELGVSGSLVSNWLNGRNGISRRHREALLKRYGGG